MNTASSFCMIIGFIGSSDIRRMNFGVASQEINHHRNLDGFYTDVWGVASQEIFGGNLVKKMAYGQKSIIGIYTDVRRMIFGSLKARNLLGKSF